MTTNGTNPDKTGDYGGKTQRQVINDTYNHSQSTFNPNITISDSSSKITNGHVLESNTWVFVIFDEAKRVLLTRNCGGVA